MRDVAPAFTHRERGTPESLWWSSALWDQVPILDVSTLAERHPHVLVVSAHPDDETLGVGGLMADLADLGVRITVMVATAGEKCQPNAPESAQALMAARRRREVELAVGGLASGAHLLHLGLPDGGLTSHEDTLREEIFRLSEKDTLILAPWTSDGHPDHDALGRAAISAAQLRGCAVVHFPIWLWHWGTPDVLPWDSLVVAETSLAGCWRKRTALRAFTSQLWPAQDARDAQDAAPLLGESMRARSRRLVETLIDEHGALPLISTRQRQKQQEHRTDGFDEMYDGGPDPWNNVDSFYEERRRALILAMLGAPRYGHVLELGCADGFLTAALIERADEVTSFDTSARAVAAARKHAARATVNRGDLPHIIPTGPPTFDLIVLSEVGYFLTATELLATLRLAQAALAPGGELLLCHWQHPTQRVPLDGALVHQQAHDFLGVAPRASHCDGDLRIEIWGDAPSVATAEGRV